MRKYGKKCLFKYDDQENEKKFRNQQRKIWNDRRRRKEESYDYLFEQSLNEFANRRRRAMSKLKHMKIQLQKTNMSFAFVYIDGVVHLEEFRNYFYS